MHTIEWILKSRPEAGFPSVDNVKMITTELPDLAENQVRVANTYISVDPYMRSRMNEGKSYIPPFVLDEPLTGGAVGKVLESKTAEFKVGDLVTHQLGWRTVAQGDSALFRKVANLDNLSESVYLGVLGLTGLTAWIGLTEIARMREGDVVFISAAAGAVGSIAGQIAKLSGAASVIGSAGSAKKIDLILSKYGYDIGINYKENNFTEKLTAASPNGIDVYFDNVGGEQLEATLLNLRKFSRIAMCGAISQYNIDSSLVGIKHLDQLIKNDASIRGFTLGNHLQNVDEFYQKMIPWLESGQINYAETVVNGIENTFSAFVDMMQGANVGKMLVKI